MSFLPCRFALEFYAPGEPTYDRFGDVRPGPGRWRSVTVASWWVDRTEEKTGESVLRLVEYLHVHCLPGDAPGPGGRVRLPDGSLWEVVGSAENFSHGFHGFDPGLVVVHATRVEG